MARGSVTSERLGSLLEAVVAMAGDRTLDDALQTIVDTASELVDAEYGFLGVLDGPSERRLGTFAVHGLDMDHQALIGGLPEGRGLLGMVIDHPEPVRIDDVAAHPDRAGFPLRHPDMTSFLGVPIRIGDAVFGNLYLTNKRTGTGFTAVDEQVAVALAGAAGVAVENARLYEQGESQRRWLEATVDIATAMLKPMSREAVKQAIAKHARDVAGADAAAVLVPDEDGHPVVAAVTGATRDIVGLRSAMPFVAEIVRTGQHLTTLDVTRDERVPAQVRETIPGLRAMHGQPLPLDDGTAVLLLGWFDGHEAGAARLDPSLARGFAQQAALAMQVVRGREQQSLLAVFEDRDRIGRDLHDLVIQRLFAVGLTLDSTARSVDRPTAARLAEAVDSLDQTIKEIRRTIFDLTQSVAPSQLRPELEQIVHETERMLGFRPSFHTTGDLEMVPAVVAEQLLAVLHEMASNVVRHSGARSLEIRLDVGDVMVLEVSDDGDGLAPDALLGNGLRNMRLRAGALGGHCEFIQPASGGLRVRWSVPKEQRDA